MRSHRYLHVRLPAPLAASALASTALDVFVRVLGDRLPVTKALVASLGFVCLLPTGVSAHGGFDERIGAANRAIAAVPTDVQPRLVRAELHRRHGDFAAALRDLDEASRLAPELPSVGYFRGLVYLDAGRHGEAEATLRRFLERKPTHPAGRAARARALMQLERPLDAAREYDLVIAQQPVPVPDYYLERARAFAAAGDAHLEDAIRGIDAGIDTIGPLVTLERAAIDLELRRGATDAALERLDRIAERSARREAWLAERGEILARAGRTEEAKQSFFLALAELDRLPNPRRHTPAISRLETKLHASLTALADHLEPRTP